MEWKEWEQVYLSIVSRLGIDPTLDRTATELLTELLRNIDPAPLLERLEDLVRGHRVVICGAGPSLKRQLQELKDTEDCFNDLIFIAADGASSVLLECGVHCDIIVTDLDGEANHIIELGKQGAIIVVHAHGDNIQALNEYVHMLGPVLGSTQVEPTSHAFLWGGFTDGDRASYLVAHYRPSQVTFIGMDFGTTVGRWSKPGHYEDFPADERKKIKLEIAQELMTEPLVKAGISYKIWK
jgi:uncharacterized Rossmann fold enzyme